MYSMNIFNALPMLPLVNSNIFIGLIDSFRQNGDVMSAFIVEDKTINTIVSFFALHRNGEWYRRQLKDIGFDLETQEGKDKLGKAMFNLNIRAVTQRYDGGAEDFRPLNYSFKLNIHFIRVTALKSLQCWLYQCTEGDSDQTELYKTMEKLKGEIACDIVRDTKEYEMAKWG